MEDRERKSSKPIRYAKVSHQERVKLVELINKEGLSIGKAARALSINLSTAKLIWKRFRTDGTFFQKISDRKARLARRASQKKSSKKEKTFDNGEQNVQENSPELIAGTQSITHKPLPLVKSNETFTISLCTNLQSYYYWYACFAGHGFNWGYYI